MNEKQIIGIDPVWTRIVVLVIDIDREIVKNLFPTKYDKSQFLLVRN